MKKKRVKDNSKWPAMLPMWAYDECDFAIVQVYKGKKMGQ